MTPPITCRLGAVRVMSPATAVAASTVRATGEANTMLPGSVRLRLMAENDPNPEGSVWDAPNCDVMLRAAADTVTPVATEGTAAGVVTVRRSVA